MMIRRSFGTIHLGHLPEGVTVEGYFAYLQSEMDWEGFTAGAFALEEGTETKRKHIQFYVEHGRKRPSTLARDFGVSTEAVFDLVRDAKGAWAYCTGTGAHKDKPALGRYEFGLPKLHGDTTRADLAFLVGLIMDGVQPEELVRAYPYAWCVHRQRLVQFYRDWDRTVRGLALSVLD